MPRSVIVTGAGGGIGAAIAGAFVAQGDLVFMADLSADRLAETRAAMKSGTAETRTLDTTDFDAFERLAAEVVAQTGRIDVLVNNAGVSDGFTTLQEATPEFFSRILSINIGGYFHGAKAVAAQMIAQKHGRIVNISSIAATRSWSSGVAYDASKAGVNGLTRRLAYELGPHGVTVNAVSPGVISTNGRVNSSEVLGADLALDRGFGSYPELLEVFIPAHRHGETTEIAATVAFLASDAAAYINGVVLPVDGGWTAT